MRAPCRAASGRGRAALAWAGGRARRTPAPAAPRRWCACWARRRRTRRPRASAWAPRAPRPASCAVRARPVEEHARGSCEPGALLRPSWAGRRGAWQAGRYSTQTGVKARPVCFGSQASTTWRVATGSAWPHAPVHLCLSLCGRRWPWEHGAHAVRPDAGVPASQPSALYWRHTGGAYAAGLLAVDAARGAAASAAVGRVAANPAPARSRCAAASRARRGPQQCWGWHARSAAGGCERGRGGGRGARRGRARGRRRGGRGGRARGAARGAARARARRPAPGAGVV